MIAPIPSACGAPRTPRRRLAPPAGRAAFVVSALIASAIVTSACASSGPEPEDDRGLSPAARAERIETLRRSIEADEATIQALISQPRAEDEPVIHDDPQLRAIAARMSGQVRRLERLEAARDAAATESSDAPSDAEGER